MDRDVRKYLGFCSYSLGTHFHYLLHRLVVFKVIVVVGADYIIFSRCEILPGYAA